MLSGKEGIDGAFRQNEIFLVRGRPRDDIKSIYLVGIIGVLGGPYRYYNISFNMLIIMKTNKIISKGVFFKLVIIKPYIIETIRK